MMMAMVAAFIKIVVWLVGMPTFHWQRNVHSTLSTSFCIQFTYAQTRTKPTRQICLWHDMCSTLPK